MRALLTSEYFTHTTTTLKIVFAAQHAQQHPECCHRNEERLPLLQLAETAAIDAFAGFRLNSLLTAKISSTFSFFLMTANLDINHLKAIFSKISTP